MSKPIEKARPYTLEDFKIDDGNVHAEDLKDEILKPVVLEKLTEIEFGEYNIMRKLHILHIREKDTIW